MASPRSWPIDDDERPSGSVRPLSQADLQAILAHLNSDDSDELLAGTDADQPVVAVRVRASVGQPGASAQAEYQRRRAAERARWTRGLPWRMAAVVAAAVAAGLLAAQVAPDLAGLLTVVGAAALGWTLRFRPSTATWAWRRGTTGERRTARLLTPWNAAAGRSSMTWPSPARRPISTTWSSAPAGCW
jgi:hypothetical protein